MTDPKLNREGIVGSSAEFDRLFGIDRKSDPKMNDQCEREMTLDEWCERLPKSHRVNRELAALRATPAPEMCGLCGQYVIWTDELTHPPASGEGDGSVRSTDGRHSPDSDKIAAIRAWVNDGMMLKDAPNDPGMMIISLLRALDATLEREQLISAKCDEWCRKAKDFKLLAEQGNAERDELKRQLLDRDAIWLPEKDAEIERLRAVLRDAPEPIIEWSDSPGDRWINGDAIEAWHERAREVLGDE